MDVGQFRDRITFYYSVKNADGYGGYTTTAGGSMDTLWGYVIPQSGNYVDSNGKRSKQKIKEVIIRKQDYDSLSIPGGYSGNSSLEDNDITFSISGDSNNYRVNNLYESHYNEYITITGTDQ